ncbi:tripartite tricarboxylate transporter TctB family protein [Paracoccus suum]|uniref:Tripartite tricarboxylate transporter TctB family protein n=1 Tax=Paracoccus suum TaxID=2259340 RepID=A0A344PG14_9RHOB|nr:tripartite tricarboxylate transporter TctB family protein [Paracoccus suum]AXC48319.1 tripartite tricarboxylate transporter TctB family protein [Paracoccus suum]
MQRDKPYWLAAGVALMGAIWLWQGLKLPQTDQYAHIGPGLPVTLVGAALIFLGAILAWQIRQGVRFEAQEAEDVDLDAGVSWRSLGLAAVAAAVPMVTMQSLGFVITCIISFWLVARAFRAPRPLLDLLVGAVLSVTAFFLFRKLGVQLGPLAPFLGV